MNVLSRLQALPIAGFYNCVLRVSLVFSFISLIFNNRENESNFISHDLRNSPAKNKRIQANESLISMVPERNLLRLVKVDLAMYHNFSEVIFN